MKKAMSELRKQVEATMNEEKESLEAYDPMHSHPDMHNCRGWVEALEYVLRQIDTLEGEEE